MLKQMVLSSFECCLNGNWSSLPCFCCVVLVMDMEYSDTAWNGLWVEDAKAYKRVIHRIHPIFRCTNSSINHRLSGSKDLLRWSTASFFFFCGKSNYEPTIWVWFSLVFTQPAIFGMVINWGCWHWLYHMSLSDEAHPAGNGIAKM